MKKILLFLILLFLISVKCFAVVDGEGLNIIGDFQNGNYHEFQSDGSSQFKGTSRIDWFKITADTITINAGTSSDVITDLQTFADGDFYNLVEAAATPGMSFTVGFINVTAFNWVNIVGCYEGIATHAVGVQLYNFDTTTWDTFNGFATEKCDITSVGEYIVYSKNFIVPDDTNYIGAGGDLGDVRIRFRHTMAGNPAHDLYLDVVALYQ